MKNNLQESILHKSVDFFRINWLPKSIPNRFYENGVLILLRKLKNLLLHTFFLLLLEFLEKKSL